MTKGGVLITKHVLQKGISSPSEVLYCYPKANGFARFIQPWEFFKEILKASENVDGDWEESKRNSEVGRVEKPNTELPLNGSELIRAI